MVRVVPFGVVDEVAISVVGANLQAILGLRADVVEPEPVPEYALLRERGQYNAGKILKELAREDGPPPIRVGITELDICLPILTFVFGEAQMGGRAAIISTHRLDEAPAGGSIPQYQLYERLAKVTVHETAHVLGLTHCRAPGCLMRFSQSLEQLDSLTLLFCDQCRYEIDRQLVTLEAMSQE